MQSQATNGQLIFTTLLKPVDKGNIVSKLMALLFFDFIY
jgi:hypothetical protein